MPDDVPNRVIAGLAPATKEQEQQLTSRGYARPKKPGQPWTRPKEA